MDFFLGLAQFILLNLFYYAGTRLGYSVVIVHRLYLLSQYLNLLEHRDFSHIQTETIVIGLVHFLHALNNMQSQGIILIDLIFSGRVVRVVAYGL